MQCASLAILWFNNLSPHMYMLYSNLTQSDSSNESPIAINKIDDDMISFCQSGYQLWTLVFFFVFCLMTTFVPMSCTCTCTSVLHPKFFSLFIMYIHAHIMYAHMLLYWYWPCTFLTCRHPQILPMLFSFGLRQNTHGFYIVWVGLFASKCYTH